MLPELTPTRFAAMVILYQNSTLSQNQLGRATAMDVATIKGVVDRLKKRGLVVINSDPGDARRNLISLTQEGRAMIEKAIPVGAEISKQTLAPLTGDEQEQLINLLGRII
ncbi:MAG TPA: MarR family transcriptional regulator [Rhizobiales bacterium]|nr:MarR family transcriptional regulator [Hyphomicrobiales bacterium]